MIKPELSIIIPTKNEEKTLPKLLESIKNQNFSDLEIIVADANSIDRTREIAENYGCKIVEGGLLAYGRNSGALAANSDLFLFTDADIILPENFLLRALKEFNSKRLDIAGTIQTPISITNCFKNLENQIYYGLANSWMIFFQKSRKPYMQVCMFVKREVHEKIHCFDESLVFAEDSEYAVKAVKAGYNFGILESPGKVQISTRRFEKEGFTLVFKYLYFNFARLFGKEFRENSRIKYSYY